MDLVGVCKCRTLHICANCQKYRDKNNCYCDFGKYKISEFFFNLSVSTHPVHGEVYSIQHYVIQFVSDLL
jgi:hypothetical protein